MSRYRCQFWEKNEKTGHLVHRGFVEFVIPKEKEACALGIAFRRATPEQQTCRVYELTKQN